MSFGLESRLVALSSCTSDIGRQIAARFSLEGAFVYGCDLKADSVDQSVFAGVSSVDLIDRAAAREWIDILVHNAGGVAGQLSQPFEGVNDEQWDSIVDINLNSTFALCRAVTPSMKKLGIGSIVILGSSASFRSSLTGIQAYCAAKHTVLGLTRQLVHELGPYGVRVNSVAPGFVLTSATKAQWDAMRPEGQRRMLELTSMRDVVQVEDIADATAFLASASARMITGQILVVDGVL